MQMSLASTFFPIIYNSTKADIKKCDISSVTDSIRNTTRNFAQTLQETEKPVKVSKQCQCEPDS